MVCKLLSLSISLFRRALVRRRRRGVVLLAHSATAAGTSIAFGYSSSMSARQRSLGIMGHSQSSLSRHAGVAVLDTPSRVCRVPSPV